MPTIGPIRLVRPHGSVIAIWVIATVGLLFRWWVVLSYRATCDINSPSCYRLAGDAWYTHSQADLISQGHWFKSGPEFFVSGTLIESAGDPPLYVTYLAAWSKLGLGSVTWHRGASTLFGFLLVVGVGLLARRIGGNIAGVVAAGLAAVHPLMWINDVMLLSEGMYQAVIVAVIWVAYDWTERPDRRRMALVGVAIAVAALTRAEAVSLFAFMVIPLVIRHAGLTRKERWHQVGVAWVAGILVLSPWLIYNNLRFDEPVSLTSASGTVMMAGACDTAWSGELMGVWDTCFERRDLGPEFESVLPGAYSPVGQGRVVYDETVRDRFMTEHAISYTLDHWKRYPLVALARMGRSLDFFKPLSTLRINYEIEGRWKAPSASGLALYYLLVPFTVVGAVAMRRRGRWLIPMLSMWAMVLFASAITFGLTRYRVPVDVAMIVMSGVGIEWIWKRTFTRTGVVK